MVKDRKYTAVAALHDMNLALAYGDRIVALKEGKLLFDETPEDVTPAMIEALYSTPCTLHRVEGRPVAVFKKP